MPCPMLVAVTVAGTIAAVPLHPSQSRPVSVRHVDLVVAELDLLIADLKIARVK